MKLNHAHHTGSLSGGGHCVKGIITIYCIGDGHTPRTAATFAHLTNWQTFSIDPVLREKKWDIRRLQALPIRIEDFRVHQLVGAAVICLVHSHADLSTCLKNIVCPVRSVISIPCCVATKTERIPDIEYMDDNIWSKKNKVQIWKNI